jgi:acyl transferase domain-containing protein
MEFVGRHGAPDTQADATPPEMGSSRADAEVADVAKVALLFPGQGAQHGRMAVGLYDHDAVFTDAVESVFTALGRDGARLRADWLGGDLADPINEITRSQPLLFAVCYGLGRMVLSWGVRPAALLGHSVGELVAATLADVFTVAGAAELVWGRVNSLARAPHGGMLAVAACEDELLPYLDGTGVTVGAVNAPGQTVLSGLDDALSSVCGSLRRDGFRCRPVQANAALHNPVLAPFTGSASQVFAGIRTGPPRLSVYSCYTAAPLTPEQATNGDFWIGQPLSTVRFWPALDALLSQGAFLLLEVGPGRVLSVIARRHQAVRSGRCSLTQLLPVRHLDGATDRQYAGRARDLLRSERLGKVGDPPSAPELISRALLAGQIPALAFPGQQRA